MAITEDEFQAAVMRGKESMKKGVAVSARVQHRSLIVQLASGAKLEVPLHMIQGLRDGRKKEDFALIEVSPSGQGLYFPRLDVDLSVPDLAAEVFGTAQFMERLGKVGGARRTAIKAAAARANGAKGGRPRKALIEEEKHSHA